MSAARSSGKLVLIAAAEGAVVVSDEAGVGRDGY